jgi:hypothetical protein
MTMYDEKLAQCERDYKEIADAYNATCVIAERQRAKIERLRAALKIIAKMPDWTGQGAGWAAKVAQHALEQHEDR